MKRTIILFISCISLFSCSDDTFRNDYETERLAIRLKEQAPALVFGPTITSITESTDPAVNTATIKVRLTAPPESDVTLDLSPVLSYGLDVVPDRVVFNSGNYSVEQEIDISTSNDDLVGGTRHYKIQFPQLSSRDPLYNDKAVPDLEITVFEDDYYPVAYPVNPYENQNDVYLYQPVRISFSKDMDVTTINDTTFKLDRMEGELAVETVNVVFSYDEQTRIATFAPMAYYKLDATYRITISTGMKDTFGNSLISDKLWSFQVTDWKANEIGYSQGSYAMSAHFTSGRLYVGCNWGLTIQDVSDPIRPVTLANQNMGSAYTGVFSTGKYVYAANGAYGLRTIDVQNSYSPSLVDTDDTAGSANGVYVKGSFAYVADGSNGLEVFSLSTPANPARVGGYNPGGMDSRFVYVVNNLAYIANGLLGLLILDVTTPATPILKGSYNTSGTALGVHVWGDYAYVADDSAGMQIIDISNPVAPALISTYKDATIESVKAVHVSGNIAYLAAHNNDSGNYNNGLWIVDVTDSKAPRFIDTYGISHNQANPYSIQVKDNKYCYITLNYYGVRIFEITNPLKTIEIGQCDLPSPGPWIDTLGLVVSSSYAYVAGGDNGLEVIDIRDPINPMHISTCVTPDTAFDVFISDTTAYVAADTKGLQVIDVTNPYSPQIIGKLDSLGDRALGVYADGDYAYVANGKNGLRKINISIPSTPELVNTCDTPGNAWGVTVSGNYAYVADGNDAPNTAGLRIIDITKSPPTIAKGFDYGCEGGRRVVKKGNLVYLSIMNCGITIYDVTDPPNAYYRGSCTNSTRGNGVAVQGYFTFMNQAENGLWIFDAFDSSNPTFMEEFPGSGLLAVSVSGSFTYLLSSTTGLHILFHPWWWPDQQ